MRERVMWQGERLECMSPKIDGEDTVIEDLDKENERRQFILKYKGDDQPVEILLRGRVFVSYKFYVE